MEKRINELFDSLTPVEAALAGDECRIERCDEDRAERILSLTQRKAGITMENRIKHTKKHSKRFIGFMAAAAIAVTGAVGAGAAYIYKKHTAADKVYGEDTAQMLESRGLIKEQVVETDEFSLNIDTTLSDGRLITFTAIVTPKNSVSLQQLKDDMAFVDVKCDLEKTSACSAPVCYGGAGYYLDEQDEQLVMRWTGYMETNEPCEKVSMPLIAQKFDKTTAKYTELARFTLDFEKNVGSRQLTDKNGQSISLCEIGVSTGILTLDKEYSADSIYNILKLEYKNGSTESFTKKINHWSSGQHTDGTSRYDGISYGFTEFIDPDEIAAVIIGETRFE